jgi:DNA sulfur modification protein DndD
VVILSTDTEIDETYFQELEPHIARAYHLSYNGEQNATHVERGYFWAGADAGSDEVESPAA